MFKLTLPSAVAQFCALAILLSSAAAATWAQEQTVAALEEAAAQFQKAQDAHEKGDLKSALAFYDQAIRSNPEFPEAEYQRAVALQQIGNRDAAEKSFRRASELRADWSLPLAKLGALLVQKAFANQASIAAQTNAADEAALVLQRAINLDPNNYSAFVALADLRLRQNAKPEVLRELLRQVKLLTDGKSGAGAAIWAARAALERVLNDLPAAKHSAARALQIQPNNVSARLERAELQLLAGDLATAADDAKFVLGLEPNNLESKILLARVSLENARPDESLKILDELPAEQKSLLPIVALRNLIVAANTNDAADVATLETALAADQKNVVLLGRLCVLNRTANPAKALEYCRRANELEPTNAQHAVGFGAALVQSKRFDDAVKVLRQILTVVPDNRTARANLAAALYEAKRYSEAIIELNRLLDAQPDSAASYFFLATAHDAIADYVEAMAAYQKFLILADPKQNQLEIEKVNLRLPILKRQIEKGAGKKKPKS